MARANATRDDKNFQKKGVSVAVAPFVESEILVDGSVFVQLPPRSLIQSVTVNVKTASTTPTSTLDVLIGANVLCNEVPAVTAEPQRGTIDETYSYLETGGELIVKAGAVTPAAGDLVGEIIVEYIELDKNTGEYTEMLSS